MPTFPDQPAPSSRLLLALALSTTLATAGPATSQGPVAASRTTDSPTATWRLTLDPAFATSWQDVNVGRLQVRSSGLQRRLPLTKSARASLEVPLERGCSLLLAEVGPEHLKGRPDAWSQVTSVAKLVACTGSDDPAEELADRMAAGSVLMAKVGSLVEIRPVANPALLRPGSDLPLLVYRDGTPWTGADIEAQGPGGERQILRTDAVGSATVSIRHAGDWTVRSAVKRPSGEEDLAATLTFRVESATHWRHLGVGVTP